MTEPTNHAEPPPLPSPSRRLHEVTMAALTRTQAAKVESFTIKRVTVGDLKDQYVVENLTLVRDPDDSLGDFMDKASTALMAAHLVVEGLNSELVREELSGKARQDALVRLRNPEGVTP